MPNELKTRYGIAEWYGRDFTSLTAAQRVAFAKHALGEAGTEPPACPFQPNHPPCSKKGGVCSIQRYAEDEDHHLRQATDAYDLTDAACRSYAWWWCHDRELDVGFLREIASTW